MAYAEIKWFINNGDSLVVDHPDHGELVFKVYEMRRLGRKLLKGERKDWWAFNSSKIIMAEELFDWLHPGLKNKLANRACGNESRY